MVTGPGEDAWPVSRQVPPPRYGARVLRFVAALFVALLFATLGHGLVGVVVVTVAALLLVSAFAWPSRVHRLEQRLKHGVSVMVAVAAFFPIYVVVFPILGLFRRGRRDVLGRRFDRERSSYLEPAPSSAPDRRPYLR